MAYWVRWFSYKKWWVFHFAKSSVITRGYILTSQAAECPCLNDVRYTSTCSIATILFTCLVVLLKTPSHFQSNLSEKWKWWDLLGMGMYGKWGCKARYLEFGWRSRQDFTKRSGKVYGLLGISTCVTCAAFASHSTLVTYCITWQDRNPRSTQKRRNGDLPNGSKWFVCLNT